MATQLSRAWWKAYSIVAPIRQSKALLSTEEPIAGLATARLSIVGLDNGAQPVSDHTGRWWVSLNGEIYNHASLRQEALGNDAPPQNDSDTAVIAACSFLPIARVVERLRGMFGLAIYDAQTHQMAAATEWASSHSTGPKTKRAIFSGPLSCARGHPFARLIRWPFSSCSALVRPRSALHLAGRPQAPARNGSAAKGNTRSIEPYWQYPSKSRCWRFSHSLAKITAWRWSQPLASVSRRMFRSARFSPAGSTRPQSAIWPPRTARYSLFFDRH